MSLCHNLWFSYPYIFETQCQVAQIYGLENLILWQILNSFNLLDHVFKLRVKKQNWFKAQGIKVVGRGVEIPSCYWLEIWWEVLTTRIKPFQNVIPDVNTGRRRENVPSYNSSFYFRSSFSEQGVYLETPCIQVLILDVSR